MRHASFPIVILIPTALLASCVAPSQRTPPAASHPATQPPAATPPPAAAPASTEWQYRPATAGDWTYGSEATGSVASFGAGPGGALLAVRCDTANHRISVARSGAGTGPMTIRTSYGAVSWPASLGAGAPAETIATRAANDGALDQIAYSRGRFGVEVQGLPPLILPAWAEVARVIEDCRG